MPITKLVCHNDHALILMQIDCICQLVAFKKMSCYSGHAMKNQSSLNNRKATLRQNKLKVTPARLAILDIFERNKHPLSVKDLAKKLSNTGIDTVTLYRNVESLQNLGLLKKILIDNKQTHYELNSQDHHHHIICKDCGRISDVSACDVTVTGEDLLKTTGFAKVTEHSLEFFGICNGCIRGHDTETEK